MGYRPKRKNKYSNLVFPTNPIVNTSSFFDLEEGNTISSVTYGTPYFGNKLENVIDSAKESGTTASTVVTPPISTVTTTESLDNFIASNAYSNRAATYGNIKIAIPDPKSASNAFLKQFEEKEAEREKALVEAARLKAESDAKAKALADKIAADLQAAKDSANAPSGDKKVEETQVIDVVTPVAKAKSSNAMLYIGVIAVGIVGLMLLKNR